MEAGVQVVISVSRKASSLQEVLKPNIVFDGLEDGVASHPGKEDFLF